MRVTWEKGDLESGRVVGRDLKSERWLIGYVYINHVQYHTLNSLRDGMVRTFLDDQALLDTLNDGHYLPLETLKDSVRRSVELLVRS